MNLPAKNNLKVLTGSESINMNDKKGLKSKNSESISISKLSQVKIKNNLAPSEYFLLWFFLYIIYNIYSFGYF